MKRALVAGTITLLMVLASLAQPQQPPPPDPAQPSPYAVEISQGDLTLRLVSDRIRQGRASLVSLSSPHTPRATFLNQPLHFFQIPGQPEWHALLVAPLSQAMRTYTLELTAGRESVSLPIDVIDGSFIKQQVIVVSQITGLFDRTVEDDELARITATASVISPTAYWQGRAFGHPVEAPLTSPFGALRTFNGLYETLHTGWDYNAPIGRPLVATAPGRVVFAGHETIRGNYVLIDHGHGIFSGYAHLSVIYVTQGQLVDGGQIVGLVGSTGRSSSAHAHFEILVNGHWIDSTDFIGLPLPR